MGKPGASAGSRGCRCRRRPAAAAGEGVEVGVNVCKNKAKAKVVELRVAVGACEGKAAPEPGTDLLCEMPSSTSRSPPGLAESTLDISCLLADCLISAACFEL
jgi:hypothetical protein